MNRKLFILLLLGACLAASAQEAAKSELHQRAETEDTRGNVAGARFHYIRAFEDYARRGQTLQATECGVKGAALYYKENYYQEAFDLLRRIDQDIDASAQGAAAKSGLHYQTSRERYHMYMKMHRSQNALEQLTTMERHAAGSDDAELSSDVLYNKTIYYYTFGQTEKGNAVFEQMARQLTAQQEHGRVEEVYQMLIQNGRKAGNANMVAQAYGRYVAWKDSATAQRHAAEVAALKQQIAEGETEISEKDSSLRTRKGVIAGLTTLAAALALALALGAVVLLRFIALTRRQKKQLHQAREIIGQKAHFISNISAQIEPTLRKLDSRQPAVQALLDFCSHVQTLSALETAAGEPKELEETPLAPFCEELMNRIRGQERTGVVLKVDVPRMSARIHRDHVAHILLHLLQNAAALTPEGGHITLEYRKRSAHKQQFMVANTGSTIPEERREDVFKPFVEVHDLTEGDGLGLPICRQMAENMNGTLTIDPEFTRGTRFILGIES